MAAAAHERLPIRIETESGVIEAELEAGRAPVTVCNFLRYMRAGDFDGGRFFRTVRSGLKGPNPVPIDVIQMEAREGPEFDRFGPIALERTSQTKLTHKAGALSMARWGPDTATSSWSIVVSDSREMDFGGGRNPDGRGSPYLASSCAGWTSCMRFTSPKRIRSSFAIRSISSASSPVAMRLRPSNAP